MVIFAGQFQDSMRLGHGGFVLVTVLAISGCASSRPSRSVSDRSAADYNSHNEDLSTVRPVYTAPTPSPASPDSRPVTPVATAPSKPAPTRRVDTRSPAGPVEALHVNRRLDAVLDTIATQNRTIRYAPGYRVQVYVGNLRQELESAKLLIYQKFPELSAYVSYNQPTYKLKVGDFMRKLDAERYYSSIRQLISSAQLQPDKVDIRRSLLLK